MSVTLRNAVSFESFGTVINVYVRWRLGKTLLFGNESLEEGAGALHSLEPPGVAEWSDSFICTCANELPRKVSEPDSKS